MTTIDAKHASVCARFAVIAVKRVSTRLRGVIPSALLLCCLVLTLIVVYAPGLRGPFLFDDFPNVLTNPWLAMVSLDFASVRDALFSFGAEYPHRGLARLSFALNHYFAQGFNPAAFKFTNVIIHAMCGVFVFLLGRLLLSRVPGVDRQRSSAYVMCVSVLTALWLLHPIQLTSVLYVVQRMTSLSGLFVMMGLCCFVYGRQKLQSGSRGARLLMSVGLAGGAFFGFFCKQNALLLPLFALLVELFFFERKVLSQSRRRFLLILFSVAISVLVLALALAWRDMSNMYLLRDFSLYQRLLTESRVLFFYLLLMVLPRHDFFGLHHDDFVVSSSLMFPVSTFFAVGCWAALVLLAVVRVRRREPWAFALLWYLAGHLFESTFIGLELVYEHRNYVPSFGPAFAVAAYLARWQGGRLKFARSVMWSMVIATTALLSLSTMSRAMTWGDVTSLSEAHVSNHPRSTRARMLLVRAISERNATLSDLYGSLQDVALRDAAGVAALVEMALIVHRLQASVEAREHDVGRSYARKRRALIWNSLVISEAHLMQVSLEISDEVARRLMRNAVSVESVHALVRLSSCIVNRDEHCLALEVVHRRWMDAALSKPDVHPELVRALKTALAKTKLSAGEKLEARLLMQDVLNGVRVSHAATFDYASMLAELGERDASIALLEEIEYRGHWSGFGAERARRAREELLGSGVTPIAVPR